MRMFRNVTIALAGASLFAITQPVMAQSAPAAEEGDGDEIIVTARKREENLIDVPLPVTVATADQLQRDQINNVNDLTRITPALEISQTGGAEASGGARLRGIGTGVFVASVSSSVALVIDQTPVGNLNFPLLYDMAQVEVLRGPQGTLFGQGASAGVINITTKAPSTSEYSGSASIDWADKGTAGSEVGELVVNAALNAPLSDTVAMRIATQYKRETGLQRSVTTGRDNVIKDFGIRMRVLFEPSDAVSINLAGEYGRNDSDGQTFFAVAIAPNSTRPFGPPGSTIGGISTAAFLNPTGCALPVIDQRAEFYCESDPSSTSLEMKAVSAVVNAELSDSLSLTSVSAYRNRTFDVFERNFSRILPQAAARAARTREVSKGFTQELRFNYAGNGFDVVFGGYYTDFSFDTLPLGVANGSNTTRVGFGVCTVGGIAPPGPPITSAPCSVNLTKNTTDNRTLAGFADATVELGGNLELFGGVRVDDFKNTTKVQSFGLVTGPLSTISISESSFSGRIGASYKPNADTNIYASFSRGYKPPAAGTDAAGRFFQIQSENADTFEIGVKARAGKLQLSANAFYSKLTNFQSQRSEFAGTALVSVPFNVSKLSSKGFELTAFGEVASGFTINAGYQFNDIKYPAGSFGDDAFDANGNLRLDDGDANIVPGLPFKLDGTQFLNAPKHKFTLSGDYEFGISDNLDLFLNGNIVWKSSVLLANRADPRFRYPSHALINLGVGLRGADDKWTASLFVRNLTKQREPTAYLASTFAGTADGGLRAWPVAGLTARVVGVRVGFNF